jgi:hypothetical protein
MSNYFQLKRGLKAHFDLAKADKVVGPIEFRFSMSGNREPEQQDITVIAKEMCIEEGFEFKDLNIYNDEGWSRMIVEILDNRTIDEYNEYLKKQNEGS